MDDKTTDVEMTREEIIASALKAREQEVMHYQINIDNYALALEEIDLLPPSERAEVSGFRDQLSNLLKSEILEQKKAKIMLNVMKRQVA